MVVVSVKLLKYVPALEQLHRSNKLGVFFLWCCFVCRFFRGGRVFRVAFRLEMAFEILFFYERDLFFSSGLWAVLLFTMTSGMIPVA